MDNCATWYEILNDTSLHCFFWVTCDLHRFAGSPSWWGRSRNVGFFSVIYFWIPQLYLLVLIHAFSGLGAVFLGVETLATEHTCTKRACVHSFSWAHWKSKRVEFFSYSVSFTCPSNRLLVFGLLLSVLERYCAAAHEVHGIWKYSLSMVLCSHSSSLDSFSAFPK